MIDSMNIIICDDNAFFADQLQRKIEDCFARRDWLLSCRIANSAKTLLQMDMQKVKVLFPDYRHAGNQRN